MSGIILKDDKDLSTELLLVGCFEEKKLSSEISQLPESLRSRIVSQIKQFHFDGKLKNTLVLEGDDFCQRVLLLGLGKSQDLNSDKIRLAYYQAIKTARELKVASILVLLPGDKDYLREVLEGVQYGRYVFQGMKSKTEQKETLQTIRIQASPKKNLLLKEQEIIFEAVSLARTLINLPSNVVTPAYLEKEARRISGAGKNVTLKVLTLKDAEKLGMGAFLGVAQGSQMPGRMLILEYKGQPKAKHKYGIIGKGITFDSGGISLKPAKGMKEMKTDMSGAAAALATMQAVATLGLAVNLLVVIPATENLPDGLAYKPGDILTAMNGKTIEVISTDAEGRLILADALTYAQKLGADKIIDIATLTGACIIAFGHIHTALMTNEQSWADKYLAAAKATGEKTWQLPMDEEYGELIESDICDMINAVDSREAGTITGAKLLQQFIEPGNAWIHLDIAGTAYQEKWKNYYGKYASGVPIRTLIELLKKEGQR